MGANGIDEEESTFIFIKREDIVFEGSGFWRFCVDIVMAYLRSKML